VKEDSVTFTEQEVVATLVANLAGGKGQFRRPVSRDVEESIRLHAGTPDEGEDEVSFRYGPYYDDDGIEQGPEWLVYLSEYPEEGVIALGQCPYGMPGDRVRVRGAYLRGGHFSVTTVEVAAVRLDELAHPRRWEWVVEVVA